MRRKRKVDWKRYKKDMEKPIVQSFIDHVYDGIKKEDPDGDDSESNLCFKAHIDKVVLSGDWESISLQYKALHSIFGRLHKDTKFLPPKRFPNYGEKYIKQLPDFLILIFLYPTEYRPPFIMEIHPRENTKIKNLKDLFRQIKLFLPETKVSMIEYALDQYCSSKQGAENLFWMEMRCLHVPYQRKAEIYGENLASWGEKIRMSTVFRINNVKVYERGLDSKKNKDYWTNDDVDRVRLEYSAPRSRLLKHGIDRVGDFIKHPRFYDMNCNIYHFKCFEGSKKLPRSWDDYPTPDKRGNVGCFQLELIRRRSEMVNINQYISDIKELDALKKRLHEAMNEYDALWKTV
jgi:hypothetical protein